MTDKELRRLKRVDLLELLISQSRENELLRQQLEGARQALAERQIKLAKAGSIAEAALFLNGVFEAAQKAADQYVENVKRHCAEACGQEESLPDFDEGASTDDGQKE